MRAQHAAMLERAGDDRLVTHNAPGVGLRHGIVTQTGAGIVVEGPRIHLTRRGCRRGPQHGHSSVTV
jgi:hypothetical protein